MEEILYKLFKEINRPLNRDDINSCDELPSYGKLLSTTNYRLKPLNRDFKKRLYLESPAKCMQCNSDLQYEIYNSERKFCDKHCSAKYNNSNRITNRDRPIIKCIMCGESTKNSNFCSHTCRQEKDRRDNIDLWLNGKIVGYKGKNKLLKNFVRFYIFEKNGGTQCSSCGWDGKHPDDGKSLTEIDHIDGNADNTKPDNLRVLCPNCHSMTSTFRARNNSSTRER